MFALLSLLLPTPAAMAHTKLVSSMPAADEVLDEAPPNIHLSFSQELERIDPIVELRNDKGELMESEPAELMADRKTVMSELSPLPNDTYTVSYRVVALDGHPIEGAFEFRVAGTEPAAEGPEPPIAPPEQPAAPALPQDTHGEHNGHGDPGHAGGTAASAGSVSFFTAVLFLSRILYYISLLPLVGWALWSLWGGFSEAEGAWRRSIGLRLQLFHLAAFGLFVVTHAVELNPSGSWIEFVRNTEIGQSWLFTGLLSVAGVALLFRNRGVDAVWALAMLAAKTLRGHAGVFEPVLLSRTLDAVHLGSASLWAGGLLALWLLWRGRSAQLRRFASAFSFAAGISLAVLVLTGVATAILYVERWSDIVETVWGWLLIVKTALVLLVLPVALGLRRRLRREEEGEGGFRLLLRADALLLAGIIGLTGVLTHVSPQPERTPLQWHVMGETFHLTAAIEDVREGVNDLTLKVWVPVSEEPPISAVAIVTGGVSAGAPVPLEPEEVESEPWEYFPSFEKYAYRGTIEIAGGEALQLTIVVERSNGERETHSTPIPAP